MNNRIFTILAIFCMILAAILAMFNLMLAASIIAGVLLFGVGLLIYRIKYGQ